MLSTQDLALTDDELHKLTTLTDFIFSTQDLIFTEDELYELTTPTDFMFSTQDFELTKDDVEKLNATGSPTPVRETRAELEVNTSVLQPPRSPSVTSSCEFGNFSISTEELLDLVPGC